jgi:hypothetical protein
MGKPRPTNATGVDVTLSVVDSNGNYRTIGKTTADSDGFYSFNWVPDIEGKYTVYASFDGSESYWPSHAVTAFNVEAAPAPSATTTTSVSQSPMELYFVGSTVAIIIAIAIVGLMILRKKA